MFSKAVPIATRPASPGRWSSPAARRKARAPPPTPSAPSTSPPALRYVVRGNRRGMDSHRYGRTLRGAFTLPEGSCRCRSFPMEGITRVFNARAPGSGGRRAERETSTASSDRSVFHGVVWGIQSLCARVPVPGGAAGEVEHQFLNNSPCTRRSTPRGSRTRAKGRLDETT